MKDMLGRKIEVGQYNKLYVMLAVNLKEPNEN